MNCLNCDGALAKMADGSWGEFCPHCGQNAHQLWLDKYTTEEKVCPKGCKFAELPQGALYCPGCGARLVTDKKWPPNDPWTLEKAPVFRAEDEVVSTGE